MTQEGSSIQDPWYLRDIVKFRNVADSTGNEVTVSPSTEVMELEPSRVVVADEQSRHSSRYAVVETLHSR